MAPNAFEPKTRIRLRFVSSGTPGLSHAGAAAKFVAKPEVVFVNHMLPTTLGLFVPAALYVATASDTASGVLVIVITGSSVLMLLRVTVTVSLVSQPNTFVPNTRSALAPTWSGSAGAVHAAAALKFDTTPFAAFETHIPPATKSLLRPAIA